MDPRLLALGIRNAGGHGGRRCHHILRKINYGLETHETQTRLEDNLEIEYSHGIKESGWDIPQYIK